MGASAVDHPVRGRRSLWLIGLTTALLGVFAAVSVAVGAVPAERTFAVVSGATQSLMSVTVPFLGVLLVCGLDHPSRLRVLSRVVTALGLALALATFGVLICVVVVAVAAPDGGAGPWRDAGLVVVGSLLVQCLAQLTGTGLGLLVRRPVLACLATIVLPLGLWALLGAVDAFRPAQAWLTPYSTVPTLLAGAMGPTAWAQWLVILAIWGAGLNTVGYIRSVHRA